MQHKLILHLQSPVFAKSLSGNFKEAQAVVDTMELNEDEPAELKAMLDHFYAKEYDVPQHESALKFHVKMFKMANYYQTETLEHAAIVNFKRTCGRSVNGSVQSSSR